MRIERVADAAAVEAGAELFDGPPRADATARFLDSPTHYRRAGAEREETPFASFSRDFTARGA